MGWIAAVWFAVNPGTCKVSKPLASVFLGNETEDVKQGASSHRLFNSCWFSQHCIRGGCHTSILKFNLSSECISRFHLFCKCTLLWVIYNLPLLSISRISLTFLLPAADCYIPPMYCCFAYKLFNRLFSSSSRRPIRELGRKYLSLAAAIWGRM